MTKRCHAYVEYPYASLLFEIIGIYTILVYASFTRACSVGTILITTAVTIFFRSRSLPSSRKNRNARSVRSCGFVRAWSVGLLTLCLHSTQQSLITVNILRDTESITRAETSDDQYPTSVTALSLHWQELEGSRRQKPDIIRVQGSGYRVQDSGFRSNQQQ